jgi:CRP-like cAMP-binding protein
VQQTVEEISFIADNLLKSFDTDQQHFTKKRNHQKRLSGINLQQRLRARQRIKDTKALKNVPVFAGLSAEATQKIVDKMEYVKIAANEPIVEQTNLADCLYIIVSGQCSVEVTTNNISKRVGTLHALDFFGENALLDYNNVDRQRNATVTSENNTIQLLSLSTKSFIDLFDAGTVDKKVIERMQQATIKRNAINETKVNEKEEDSTTSITSTTTTTSTSRSSFEIQEEDSTDLMEGHAINEMKLRKQIDIQRKTSVNRTQLRVLARQRLKQTKAFAQIPLFQSLGAEQIELLINAMEHKIYQEGAALCVQGDAADCLFILISGQCKVTIQDNTNDAGERRVGTLYELDFIGEHALLDINSKTVVRKRTATVTSEIGTANVLELSREKFVEIMKTLDASLMIPDGFMKHLEELAVQRKNTNESYQAV